MRQTVLTGKRRATCEKGQTMTKTNLLSTGTNAQILRALLGAQPTVQDLRTELDDLEGMRDSEAAYLYGSLARKQAYEAHVARLFFKGNMRSAR